jgi:uncharacterized protein (TIRG00374 family)
MMSDGRRTLAKRSFVFVSLAAGVTLLAWVLRRADLGRTVEELSRMGLPASGLFVACFGVAFLGPTVGWHLLLRSEGIPVSFWTTLSSALMGKASNLVSPLMYFGGESVRTFHLAHASGIPKRRVLATIIVSEFQLLAGMSVSILAGCCVLLASSPLSRRWILYAILGAIALAAFMALILGLLLGKTGPVVRAMDVLIRIRIFPKSLASLRSSALEMESTVREIFGRRRGTFLAAQALTLLSPLSQIPLPALFFLLVRRAGGEATYPGASELAAFFVLSQLLFMLPATPGGVGMYEGGMIGLFSLLGWKTHEGAAFSILWRVDELVFLAVGGGLMIHYGLTRWLLGRGPGGGDPPSDPPVLSVAAPSEAPVSRP